MKKISLLIIALAMLIAITGVVMADQPVPAVFSKQKMVTTTTATVDGTVIDDNTMALTITRNPNVLVTMAGPAGLGFAVSWPNNAANQARLAQTAAQLAGLGGAIVWHIGAAGTPQAGLIVVDSITVPEASLAVRDTGLWGVPGPGWTYNQVLAAFAAIPGWQRTTVNQGIHTGILNPGEVRADTTYESGLVAQNGETTYVRQSTLDTNNKLIGQSNFAPKTTVNFMVNDVGGTAAGDEKITLNTLGTRTVTSQSMMSPFGPSIVGPVIPPYDDLVQAGGAFDITQGVVTTDANERFIASDAGVPNALNYKINLKGITTQTGLQPALGSASGWIDVDVKEGRTATNTVSETIRYKSSASANGVINGFTKTVGWLSGTNHV